MKDKKRTRKVRNLIILLAFTAIILSISTYAWFIGMRTVNVSSFDVEIASTDSLLLSLNGEDWDYTVSISKDTFDDDKTSGDGTVYDGHTNWWAGKGLSPVSSVGRINTDVGRLVMYEKTSLTASPGGYRLISDEVENDGTTELDGYVAFDLFIKNFSGTQYIKALNELDEEAIYLLPSSEVKVADGGVANTGIENSVRVAFAQIGRVIATTTDVSTITDIDCNVGGTNENVTGICSRTAQIWEPNDTRHVENAIKWYNESCKTRTAAPITDPASYSGACQTIVDKTAYPTYAVKSKIESSDQVDVYDGTAYNSYAGSSAFLEEFPYFTDTKKNLTGNDRPTFMTLAPNSITKVRIYIYIEGQDIDNYDFASIGKAISVKFGFTKERYTEEDIEYNGPALGPVLTLREGNPLNLPLGTPYEEPGATAVASDGTTDITSDIEITGTVDENTPGEYTITYRVTDSEGYLTTRTRKVIVQ